MYAVIYVVLFLHKTCIIYKYHAFFQAQRSKLLIVLRNLRFPAYRIHAIDIEERVRKRFFYRMYYIFIIFCKCIRICLVPICIQHAKCKKYLGRSRLYCLRDKLCKPCAIRIIYACTILRKYESLVYKLILI